MVLDPPRKKQRRNPLKSRQRAVVRLQDLAPAREVTGGAGKLLFGEATEPQEHTREESAPRDDAKES